MLSLFHIPPVIAAVPQPINAIAAKAAKINKYLFFLLSFITISSFSYKTS
ncbi:hypothetical protein J6P68_05375 [bacterium]|nr:hypothetical protein [bacterium]